MWWVFGFCRLLPVALLLLFARGRISCGLCFALGFAVVVCGLNCLGVFWVVCFVCMLRILVLWSLLGWVIFDLLCA